MIFGKEYDLSLWYMLNVKNRNRRKIIKLIKELPEEALEKIKIVYSEIMHNNELYRLDRSDEVIKVSSYTVPSDTETNVCYTIDSNCAEIIVIKKAMINGSFKNVFTLILWGTGNALLERFKEVDRHICFGSITKGQIESPSFVEVDYELRKTPLGNMMACDNIYLMNLLNIKSYHLPIMRKLPEEVDLTRENISTRRLSKIIKR